MQNTCQNLLIRYRFGVILVMLAGFCLLPIYRTSLVYAEQPVDPTDDKLGELEIEDLLEVYIVDHAPMGIHHFHKKGEWMFGYSRMYMKMAGNRDGTESLRSADVLQDFMVTPLEMNVDGHMFHAMYALTDDMLLMVMGSYVEKSMSHRTRMGQEFTTRSAGIGDLKTTLAQTLYSNDRDRIYFSLGMSFPTGSIDRQDDTPAGHQRLPYPMQIGSGTYDLLPGITYLGKKASWRWGGHVEGTVRLGRNDNDYSAPDEVNATTWLTHQLNNYCITYARLDGKAWSNIDGADPALNPMMVPTADPNRRGGERIDMGVGFSLLSGQNKKERSQIDFEFAVPIYQSLEGPQLEMDWMAKIAVSVVF